MNWVEIPVVNATTMPAGSVTKIAAVQLPEPMCEGRPEIDAGCGAVVTHDGHDVIFAFPNGSKHYRSPEKARQLAAALLASANTVDGDR